MPFHFHFSLGGKYSNAAKLAFSDMSFKVLQLCDNGVISKFMGEIRDVKSTHWVSTTINFLFLPSRSTQKTGRKTLQMWAGSINLYCYSLYIGICSDPRNLNLQHKV